jgi:hypothetical protein
LNEKGRTQTLPFFIYLIHAETDVFYLIISALCGQNLPMLKAIAILFIVDWPAKIWTERVSTRAFSISVKIEEEMAIDVPFFN